MGSLEEPLLWLLVLLACYDTIFVGHEGGEGTVEGDGWCGVQRVLVDCTSCHSATAAAGGLDLLTDPHAALVEVVSSATAASTARLAHPPEGIDDAVDCVDQVYQPHTEHLGPEGSVDHASIDCSTCHVVPTRARFAGHLFNDDTPGQAEVTLSGLATGGSWSGQSCTVYCHGDGQVDGSVEHTDGPRHCRRCHPDRTNDAGWRGALQRAQLVVTAMSWCGGAVARGAGEDRLLTSVA